MESNKRVIVIAKGGNPSYDRKLKHRLLSQLKWLKVKDIVIIGESKLDFGRCNGQADYILKLRDKWNKNGRTVVLNSNVYYSDEAIREILRYRGRGFKLFCRDGGSKLTGIDWSEPFAITMYPHSYQKAEAKLSKLNSLFSQDKVYSTGLFEWANLMSGITDAQVKNHASSLACYEIIDDATTNITSEYEYKRIVALDKKRG